MHVEFSKKARPRTKLLQVPHVQLYERSMQLCFKLVRGVGGRGGGAAFKTTTFQSLTKGCLELFVRHLKNHVLSRNAKMI